MTIVEVDEKLLADAMRASGAHTKKEAVESALRLMILVNAQSGIRKLKAKDARPT
jgi:Arc/MetJ family transcription regulator